MNNILSNQCIDVCDYTVESLSFLLIIFEINNVIMYVTMYLIHQYIGYEMFLRHILLFGF